MFDVGFAELFLLSVIGLLVLGPERLPAVARTLGGFMRKARASWFSLKRTIEAELAATDEASALSSVSKEFKDLSRDVQEYSKDFKKPLDIESARAEAEEASQPAEDDDDENDSDEPGEHVDEPAGDDEPLPALTDDPILDKDGHSKP